MANGARKVSVTACAPIHSNTGLEGTAAIGIAEAVGACSTSEGRTQSQSRLWPHRYLGRNVRGGAHKIIRNECHQTYQSGVGRCGACQPAATVAKIGPSLPSGIQARSC